MSQSIGAGSGEERGQVPVEDGLFLAWHRVGPLPGKGAPPAIIVPAMGWLDPDLIPFRGERCFLFYDIRGQGRSAAASDGQVAFEHDVADLGRLLDGLCLGTEEMPVDLLGWSYHGALCARFAHAYPGRVRRMALLAPIAPRANPFWGQYLDAFASGIDPAGLLALEADRRAGGKERDPVGWCRALTRLIFGVYVADVGCLKHMQADPCVDPNVDQEIVNAQTLRIIEQMGDYDWREEMRGMPTEALILHGDQDPVPFQGSEEWAELMSSARLVRFEGTGHMPWLECPERFADALADFLGSPAGAG